MLPKSHVRRACLGALGLLALPWHPACAQAGGVTPEWDARKQMETLASRFQKFNGILEQIKPQEWLSQGAPDAYVGQMKSARSQLQSLGYSIDRLTKDPAKLTAALDAFFRIESLNAMLRSLAQGVRKYQNPALADLLQSMVADGVSDRDKLRQYILDLAADREQQFKVIDEEAQRCRTVLSRQPPPRRTGSKKEEHR